MNIESPQSKKAKAPAAAPKLAAPAGHNRHQPQREKNAANEALAPACAAAPPPPDPADDYMSPAQLDWFQYRLLEIRELYQRESVRTAQGLRFQEKSFADEIDRANSEFDYVVDLRENERLGNLQHKIDHVLRLIKNNQYGFCSECREPIGLERMRARPVATLCIDCKQYNERLEKQNGS